MSMIKTFMISIYAVISIMISSLALSVIITSTFDYEADILTQIFITAFVTYVVIYPVIKIRKRLLTLTEKLLIIIPFTALTVLLRLSTTYGNTDVTTPDEKILIAAVLVAITDFIPVWLVISTYAYRIYKLPNK